MKRSQVEKIIENTINANTQDSPEELASIILFELEEAGMSPPNIEIDPIYDPETRTFKTLSNQWEPEND
jgi:hypothetical protein